ncbi:MAG: N-acetyltransferase [Flavobacteriales bacterium]|nr:N-acetyltransferase [Flavobacteriales bacterium]
MIKITQEDDGSKGKFVLFENNDLVGEMTYTWAGTDKFIIDHTEVKPIYGGKGYGKILVQKGVEFARETGVKIIPLCPFAKAEFDKKYTSMLIPKRH